ncbi:MAG: UbiD family decarboxylase [Pirellulaceae bacterium]|nr:UbiD family decarboxylase [Pirellulaceae bacterium]
MRYRSTRQLVEDLRSAGRLIEITTPVDPHLELAEIHRRVYASDGPALLFSNVQGCRFPVASNLLGSLDRARWIFRDTFESLQLAIRWKVHPEEIFAKPWQLWRAPQLGLRMLPRRTSRPAVMSHQCRLSELPQIVCWPDDGGPFVTLPQVLSLAPDDARLSSINLGMYRIQMGGNNYVPDQECGLHYQLHRGIGVHHSRAIELKRPFPVNVTVGGTPSMTVAAVMPLPEGMSELGFAGALAGGRIPLYYPSRQSLVTNAFAPLYADADFAIVGSVDPTQLKPEGPFGDHLGYYARVHDFPLLNVTQVWHRPDAVWPMTVVGRPPQEDTVFGELIHELTGPVIPTVLPGVRAVHAVDAAGVHPLLLAIGSERYTPYARPGRPQELLTQASAILGQGQLSLAKYLWITDLPDDSPVKIHDVEAFLAYMLARVDWRSDLHFHTRTTIDTLDYSGDGLNAGSKLVVAATGKPRRELPTIVPESLTLPAGWRHPHVALPGVLCVEADRVPAQEPATQPAWQQACDRLDPRAELSAFPLVVLCDDAAFASRSINNFVWVTFTRSNPAVDVYGFGASMIDKHFAVSGSLVIDARVKPHHAPPLIEDPHVSAKVDALAAQNLPVSKYL